MQSGFHGRAGRNAVVNHDRRTPCQGHPRSASQIQRPAAFDLGQLARAVLRDIALGDLELAYQRLVEDRLRAPAVDDGAERELRLERRTDLAHQDQIEWRFERAGDLESDGNPAAREGSTTDRSSSNLSSRCAADPASLRSANRTSRRNMAISLIGSIRSDVA
jgi:hypothetical protein